MTRQPWPRLLLFGERGQVGWELVRTLAPLGDLAVAGRSRVDLEHPDQIRSAIRAARPSVIVNAAAYTKVDQAEKESALATRINGDAPTVMAEEAARSGALMVHYSTDYVFDGRGSTPYRESDPMAPTTAYGVSKRAGDDGILGSGADGYIFRVAWVYANRGQNFLRTMSRLARERPQLRVVADQHGSPTWARAIAETTALAISRLMVDRRDGLPAAPTGVYHMASQDSTTWHGFASAIVERLPFDEGSTRPEVVSITTDQFPTPARRPAWSILDSTKLDDAFGLRLPS